MRFDVTFREIDKKLDVDFRTRNLTEGECYDK